jgi:hypothetical protein
MARRLLRSTSSENVLLRKLRKELRQVGRVLLLEQIHQVRCRPHALEALHRVEDHIQLPLRHESFREK